ncbi:MAG TPA: MBOAT family O-acyltransferase, partial [Gemmatimonadales bacterium]|nr:MBOAT family O-acyltransferase [Gemmatimonadales bacterium]
LGQGLRLMFSGLFKKILIADRLAVAVNAVYADPRGHSAAELLLATWCFAIQIYCDFAGYTEIARGAAKVMGFDLMLNFNRPYLATSIVEFWRRWHISLSTWFRDYLYIPLGGNRGSRGRTCLNLAFVFLVSGLWHGANWTFIVWGALHALFVVLYVLSEAPRARFTARLGRAGRVCYDLAAWLVTFNLVCLAWVFFRAATLADAVTILRRIAAGIPGVLSPARLGLDATQAAIAALLVLGLALAEMASRRAPTWDILDRQPRVARWTAYYVLGAFFLVMLLFSPQQGPQPFVYFQF